MHSPIKVAVTYGPSLQNKLEEAFKSGAKLLRINFSHTKASDTENIVKEAQELGFVVFGDLQGPKIRIGEVERKLLKKGVVVSLEKDLLFDTSIVSAQVGDKIIIADGFPVLEVIEVSGGDIKAKVLEEGEIFSRAGIAFPDSHVKVHLLSKQDIENIEASVDIGYDLLAISFVSNAADVFTVRNLTSSFGRELPLIAKIERKIALKNLEEIAAASDILMVARGDLGVEIGEENVPWAQKQILKTAIKNNKPSMVATQLLDSMVSRPAPSRAEVTDITTAVTEGADSLLLTKETALGQFPIETIRTAVQISSKATEYSTPFLNESLPSTVVEVANYSNSEAIFVITYTGTSLLLISSLKPKQKIFALSNSDRVEKLSALTYNTIYTHICSNFENTENLVKHCKKIMKEYNIKRAVIFFGLPLGKPIRANTISVIDIDDN